jgi:hypothetical protein
MLFALSDSIVWPELELLIASFAGSRMRRNCTLANGRREADFFHESHQSRIGGFDAEVKKGKKAGEIGRRSWRIEVRPNAQDAQGSTARKVQINACGPRAVHALRFRSNPHRLALLISCDPPDMR